MSAREAWIVVDLGHGDQGKGTITDFLVRDRAAHTVVRHNGGAQAGHRVVTDDGREHVFAQLGAGSFVPGVETLLTRDVAIQPWALIVEAEHLARAGVPDGMARVSIEEDAPVITPFHRAANRLRERARGAARHGSCGVGVGETVCDARAGGDVVRARDLRDRARLRAKMIATQERKRAELGDLGRDDPDAAEDLACLDDPGITDAYLDALAPFAARIVDGGALSRVLARDGAVVFEGAQGVLLDERWGFHPYTTWSDCTPASARRALAGHDARTITLGVVRAYATRHGAGPLPTEDASMTERLPDARNVDHPWQGGFRVGAFDAVATRYAIHACGGIDALAVTCADRLDATACRIATSYEIDGAPVRDLDPGDDLTARVLRARPIEIATHDERGHLDAIARETMAISLVSRGETARDKTWIGEPR